MALLIASYSAQIANLFHIWRCSDCLQNLSCFMISDTVIVGEIANFVAYAFAPAVLVTPLGALSIIVR